MAFGISATAYAIGGSAILGAYSSNKASKGTKQAPTNSRLRGDAAANSAATSSIGTSKSTRRRPRNAKPLLHLTPKVGDAQYRGMELATQQAQELDARNKGVFRRLRTASSRMPRPSTPKASVSSWPAKRSPT